MTDPWRCTITRSSQSQLRNSQHVRTDPTLSSHLVRIGCSALGLSPINLPFRPACLYGDHSKFTIFTMSPKKRSLPFQLSHIHQYAVQVTQRGSENPSLVYGFLLCVYFCREAKIGAKHQCTTNIKVFTKPFPADNYAKGHVKKHSEYWQEHQAMAWLLFQYSIKSKNDRNAFLSNYIRTLFKSS